MLIASEMLKETVISVPRRIAKSYLLALAQRLTDDLQVLQRVLGEDGMKALGISEHDS